MATRNKVLASLNDIDLALRGMGGGYGPPGGIAAGFANPTDPRTLCADYHQIRPKLDVALTRIEEIPDFGRQLATAIRFLMQVADAHCGYGAATSSGGFTSEERGP